jgi:penicillin-binding protein 1B
VLVVVASRSTSAWRGLIDDRLYGERERSLPRVYARPIEIPQGQTFTQQDLIARLNDIGYAQRPTWRSPASSPPSPTRSPSRRAAAPTRASACACCSPSCRESHRRGGGAQRGIQDIQVEANGRADSVELDRPVLTALMTSGARQKRRRTPLANIPVHMQQAVLSIEDRSFYSHPGVNPLRLAAVGVKSALGIENTGGTSTITQQLSRMFFLADEFNAELQSGERGKSWDSYVRKAREGLMSLVLERKASKKEILELYLNDVYLGQRGSFAIHGVAEPRAFSSGRTSPTSASAKRQ